MPLDIPAAPDAVFGRHWWGNFIEQSNRLRKAAVFKGCIEHAALESYRTYVLTLLQTLCASKVESGFRVFVGGKLQDSGQMQRVHEAPPEDCETLERWVERVFGDQQFGIIINYCERFSQGLAKDIAVALAPLFEELGFPRDGVKLNVFLGNYDKTPLGIHQDPRGENVMHFHLGPSSKTMYLWQKEAYAALLDDGRLSRDDLDGLRVHAKKFVFEQGDVFFMPEGEYHIGEQEGLSMGVTVWQCNHTDELLARNLHRSIFKNIEADKHDLIDDDDNDLDDTSAIDALVQTYRLADELAMADYGQLLRKTYRDQRYRLHSNAGYAEAPIPREESAAFALDEELEVEFPYRIILRREPEYDKMYIYVRGKKIQLKDFSCVTLMIDKINQNGPHTVRALLDELDTTLAPQHGLYILKQLHRWHGIRRARESMTTS